MYFVIYKSTDDKYYFNIKSDNGQVVATSETYNNKSSANDTIESIKQKINKDTAVVDVTK